MVTVASIEAQLQPLSGLHLLLTYKCNYECDHCFVWGGPSQKGTMAVDIIAGGPAEIVRRYDLPHQDGYADHCHLCYRSRCTLRARFPNELTPDQMYGGAG